ncbi:hypothetical protein LX32DRAFT_317217 [Colletotrichum zoysiae]|uniref:Uncharacterized protein n=1 Tax=Colletotrichum zoysiae TaxID=1216348 RepID=A0AAD9HLS3_9PEZI|nr:hypothetical protein LX32DRAFT_317217 [Colletotrichum zoysiae]
MLQKQWDDGVVRVDAWRLQAGRVSSCDALVTECPAEQGACASMAKPGQPWDCTDQSSNRSNHLPTHAALGLKSRRGMGKGGWKGCGCVRSESPVSCQSGFQDASCGNKVDLGACFGVVRIRWAKNGPEQGVSLPHSQPSC